MIKTFWMMAILLVGSRIGAQDSAEVSYSQVDLSFRVGAFMNIPRPTEPPWRPRSPKPRRSDGAARRRQYSLLFLPCRRGDHPLHPRGPRCQERGCRLCRVLRGILTARCVDNIWQPSRRRQRDTRHGRTSPRGNAARHGAPPQGGMPPGMGAPPQGGMPPDMGAPPQGGMLPDMGAPPQGECRPAWRTAPPL